MLMQISRKLESDSLLVHNSPTHWIKHLKKKKRSLCHWESLNPKDAKAVYGHELQELRSLDMQDSTLSLTYQQHYTIMSVCELRYAEEGW